MKEHEKINYVEFPAIDIEKTKQFFIKVFNWSFTDYGPEYSAFDNQGIDGGFYKSDKCSATGTGSALVVFYSNDLQATLEKIKKNGGRIIQDTFSFPGGCRFHFTDPSGNEFAVWSENCEILNN